MKTVSYELASELLSLLKLAQSIIGHPDDAASKSIAAAIAKAEAAMAEPQPDADGWIKWNGGECPAPDDTWVEVLLRNGENIKGQAADGFWHHGLGNGDIIAYRIVKEPQ